MNKISSTAKTVLLTLNVVGLLVVLVQGYINNQFEPTTFVVLGIFALNIISLVTGMLVRNKTNGNSQTPPEVTGQQ